MIADFRDIAYKSGGLRAGLYRGFLPYIIHELLTEFEIEKDYDNSTLDKLEISILASRLLTLNIFYVIFGRLQNTEYAKKATFFSTAKIIF